MNRVSTYIILCLCILMLDCDKPDALVLTYNETGDLSLCEFFLSANLEAERTTLSLNRCKKISNQVLNALTSTQREKKYNPNVKDTDVLLVKLNGVKLAGLKAFLEARRAIIVRSQLTAGHITKGTDGRLTKACQKDYWYLLKSEYYSIASDIYYISTNQPAGTENPGPGLNNPQNLVLCSKLRGAIYHLTGNEEWFWPINGRYLLMFDNTAVENQYAIKALDLHTGKTKIRGLGQQMTVEGRLDSNHTLVLVEQTNLYIFSHADGTLTKVLNYPEKYHFLDNLREGTVFVTGSSTYKYSGASYVSISENLQSFYLLGYKKAKGQADYSIQYMLLHHRPKAGEGYVVKPLRTKHRIVRIIALPKNKLN